MKLLFCHHCYDVRKLQLRIMTYCACGKSYGQYNDNLKAEMNKEDIPLGISNSSFRTALSNRPITKGYSRKAKFEAFLIEDNCPTINIIE